jgi:hypothetical protein
LSQLPAGADPLDAAAAIGAGGIGGPITIVIAGGATVFGIAVGKDKQKQLAPPRQVSIQLAAGS